MRIVRGFNLPSSHQPADPSKHDAVDAWVVLMKKWDAAYKDYLSARNARAAGEAKSGDPSPELKHREAQALALLAEIKAEMDKVVADTRQRREPIGESIVVGTITTGEVESENPGETGTNPSER